MIINKVCQCVGLWIGLGKIQEPALQEPKLDPVLRGMSEVGDWMWNKLPEVVQPMDLPSGKVISKISPKM